MAEPTYRVPPWVWRWLILNLSLYIYENSCGNPLTFDGTIDNLVIKFSQGKYKKFLRNNPLFTNSKTNTFHMARRIVQSSRTVRSHIDTSSSTSRWRLPLYLYKEWRPLINGLSSKGGLTLDWLCVGVNLMLCIFILWIRSITCFYWWRN